MDSNSIKTNLTNYSIEAILSDAGNIFKIRRRQTHRQKKQGIALDVDSVIAELRLSIADEFKCSYLEVSYDEDLLVRDWDEILTSLESLILPEQMVFMRVHKSLLENPSNLSTSLVNFGFVLIEDEDVYEHERRIIPWMPIFMCLGMSMGMSFALFGAKVILGMCYGMAIGMFLGAVCDYRIKTKRQALKDRRFLEKNN